MVELDADGIRMRVLAGRTRGAGGGSSYCLLDVRFVSRAKPRISFQAVQTRSEWLAEGTDKMGYVPVPWADYGFGHDTLPGYAPC